MKINMKVRVKNPYFWIGLLGVVLAAMGISPEMLTSWGAVIDAIKELVMNPFMLGSVIAAVIGVLNDPTTAGIKDSSQAMLYGEPKKEN